MARSPSAVFSATIEDSTSSRPKQAATSVHTRRCIGGSAGLSVSATCVAEAVIVARAPLGDCLL